MHPDAFTHHNFGSNKKVIKKHLTKYIELNTVFILKAKFCEWNNKANNMEHIKSETYLGIHQNSSNNKENAKDQKCQTREAICSNHLKNSETKNRNNIIGICPDFSFHTHKKRFFLIVVTLAFRCSFSLIDWLFPLFYPRHFSSFLPFDWCLA